MKIAHVSKPWLPVPSVKYGAIEKMLAYLIAEQVKTDEVTLFAPGNSKPARGIHLNSLFDEGIGDKGYDRNIELAQTLHAVLESQKYDFDVIHAHSTDPIVALASVTNLPLVFTFHSVSRFEGQILTKLAQDANITFVFLSKSHREQYPWIANAEVVHYGLPVSEFPFYEKSEKQDYLAFIGAISDRKGILEAIQVATSTNHRLKIAGKTRASDQAFFDQKVKPIIENNQLIEFVGEIDNNQRNEFLGKAKALLFPIKWQEPFGLVMLESLVVGTPVIAFNKGSVPEVITDDVGFIAKNVAEMSQAVERISTLSSRSCRNYVENNFSIKKMADTYNRIYEKVVASS